MDAFVRGIPEETILECDSMDALGGEMRALASGSAPIVILVDRPELLDRLGGLSDWLGDFPLFLILPDHNPATISKGFSFFPRYLGFVEQEPETLVDVLSFVIDRLKKQQEDQK
jgi:hypothetical protein